MRILALESSAVSAGVAVCENGIIRSESFINNGLTHSQTLLSLADSTLRNAGLSMQDIDCLAVSAGPGSFTGIRIGVSCAKGLAFPDDKPCYGISTLEAMAWSVSNQDALICPMMDARCNQVYTALFRCRNNNIERLTADSAMKIDEWIVVLQEYNEKTVLIGDGVSAFCDTLVQAGIDIELVSQASRYQHANGVALAAWNRHSQGILPIHHEHLVPCYLRLSQAERERQNKEKGAQNK